VRCSDGEGILKTDLTSATIGGIEGIKFVAMLDTASGRHHVTFIICDRYLDEVVDCADIDKYRVMKDRRGSRARSALN
jgi:hypothetical protein